MKLFYKFISLLFIFGVAIFLFKDNIPETTAGTTIATDLQDATFPVVYIGLGNIL